MPSPIAHLSGGSLLRRWAAGRCERVRKSQDCRFWPLLLTGCCLFFTMLPDIDAVIGILAGDLGRFHNQGTHSLLALALATAAGGSVFYAFFRENPRLCFWIAFLCYGLHLLMDFFCYGRGLKLLWPWLDIRIKPHLYIFMGVHWSDGLRTPWHLLTALNEVVFVFLLVWILRLRRAHIRRTC